MYIKKYIFLVTSMLTVAISSMPAHEAQEFNVQAILELINKNNAAQHIPTTFEPLSLPRKNQIEMVFTKMGPSPLVLSRALGMVPPVIQQHEIEELQLSWLADSLDSDEAREAYKAPQTILGSANLYQLVMFPENDLNVLLQRQRMIRSLADDHIMQAQLQKHLRIMKQSQSVIMHRLADDESNRKFDRSTQRLFYEIPFAAGYLNQNLNALEFKPIYENAKHIGSILASVGLLGFWEGLNREMWKERPSYNFFKWIKDGLYAPWRHLDPSRDLTKDWGAEGGKKPSWPEYNSAFFQGTLGDRYHSFRMGYNREIEYSPFPKVIEDYVIDTAKPRNALLSGALAVVPTALWGFWFYWTMKSSYESLHSEHKSMECARAHITYVARYVRAMLEITKIIQQSELQQSVIGQHVYQAMQYVQNNPEAVQLIELLQTPTFDGALTNTLLYRRGIVLQAYRLFLSSWQYFMPLAMVIGEVDAFAALAMRVHADHWKPVTYLTDTKPTLYIEEFLTPVQQQSVANSITLGGNEKQHLIVTGPNGAGKSFALRLIIGHSAVLAQSIGFVPAKNMALTPFTHIVTSMCPREQMEQGRSTFMAQVEALDHIVSVIEQSQNRTCLALMDEPYSGTVNDEMARRAGMLCDRLNASPCTLSAMATHVMPLMSNTSQSAFQHKHVVIEQLRSGGFKPTYKLENGICNWWFNNIELRRAYVDWLGTRIPESKKIPTIVPSA